MAQPQQQRNDPDVDLQAQLPTIADQPAQQGQIPTIARQPLPTYQPNPQRQAHIQQLQNQLQSQENRPSPHGFLGKAGRVLQTIGDVAGNALIGPANMSLIPGTAQNRSQTHAATEGELEKEEKAEQGAQKQFGENQLQGTQAENYRSETQERDNPQAKPQDYELKEITRPDGTIGYAAVNKHNPNDVHEIPTLNAPKKDVAVKGMESKGGTLNGKPAFENFHPDTGKFTDPNTGQEVQGFQPTPPLAATQGPWMVGPNNVAAPLHPGQKVAPGSMSPTQIGAGSAADVKETKTENKVSENLNSELGLMKGFAANPSPTNDAAMLMHYIGATKPESMGKIRLNDRELKLFGGTRSSLGDVEALFTKVTNGQSLTPKQRNDMVNTMTMIAHAASTRGEGSPYTAPQGADNEVYVKGQLVGHTVGGKYVPLGK